MRSTNSIYCIAPFGPVRAFVPSRSISQHGQPVGRLRLGCVMKARPWRERLWEKVDKSGDCWVWTASVDGGGYGQIAVNGTVRGVHRISYEETAGPIPDGLEIDHLCRNRRCVRPSHLEAVSHRENILRGISFSAENARKTHCPRGHPLSGSNILMHRFLRIGKRVCRTCTNEQQRAAYHRRKADA